jgi:hypothetical protein
MGCELVLAATEVRECGLKPEATEETLQAFSSSEKKLYQHHDAMAYKWIVDDFDSHNQFDQVG